MTSIFESLYPVSESTALWSAAPESSLGRLTHSGYLFKHSNKGQGTALVQRNFYIEGDYLLYKTDKDSSRPSAAMNLRFAKMTLSKADSSECSTDQHNFEIKLSRGTKYSLLYARTGPEYEEWVQALTKVTIRSDIHERFDIDRSIGAGSFAQVFLATDKMSGHQVAVKGFNKNSIASSSIGVQSLGKEIDTLRKLSGIKNIVDIKEVHETKNSVYIILELVEGGDLLSYISSNAYSLTEFVNISYGLLSALDSLSKMGMYHRDIKPANIMLRKKKNITPEDIVIVDFGLAAHSQDSCFLYKRCGTPGYIAPEVIAMKNVDQDFSIPAKCDIYSAGVVLHQLCTGEPLFDKPELEVNEILKANYKARVIFTKEDNQKFGKDAVDLLCGLLQAKPERRLSFAEALGHPLFYHFHEENIDSSSEESAIPEEEIEEDQDSSTFEKRILSKCSGEKFPELPPTRTLREQLIRKDNIMNPPIVPMGKFPGGSSFLKMNTTTTKDTVSPYSPVISQSRDIEEKKLGQQECEGFTHLTKDGTKLYKNSPQFRHLVKDGQSKRRSLGSSTFKNYF